MQHFPKKFVLVIVLKIMKSTHRKKNSRAFIKVYFVLLKVPTKKVFWNFYYFRGLFKKKMTISIFVAFLNINVSQKKFTKETLIISWHYVLWNYFNISFGLEMKNRRKNWHPDQDPDSFGIRNRYRPTIHIILPKKGWFLCWRDRNI